jgi:bacillolysin/thermolysin
VAAASITSRFRSQASASRSARSWPASLARSLDVVAHEFTHGLVHGTAQLGGEGESGVLDEAICDLFACLITGDWLIGETIFHPNGRLTPLRNLQNPANSGNPETLAQWIKDGDVHLNSTIASHAGFLMARDLGGDAAARIWYRALTRYLTSRAELADAADATIASARDFGRGEEAAVRDAWVAVGVVSE